MDWTYKVERTKQQERDISHRITGYETHKAFEYTQGVTDSKGEISWV